VSSLDFRHGSYTGEKKQRGGKTLNGNQPACRGDGRAYIKKHPPAGGGGKSSLTASGGALVSLALPRKRRERRAPRGMFAPGRKCEIAGDAQCAVKYTRASIFPLARNASSRATRRPPPPPPPPPPRSRTRRLDSVLAISRSFSGSLHIELIAPVQESFTSAFEHETRVIPRRSPRGLGSTVSRIFVLA